MKKYKVVPLLLLLLGLLTACRIGLQEPVAVPPEPATPVAAVTIEVEPTETPVPPTAAVAPTATPRPTETMTATPAATPAPPDIPAPYQIIFVEEDDTLNVRTGPGVEHEVAGQLAPDASQVHITGPGQTIDGSLWVPIVAGSVSGWANSYFLTEMVTSEAFCNDEAAVELLDAFRESIENRDGEGLAELVHPQRGLLIQRHWWNREVRFTAVEVSDLFTSLENHDWGIADGTGDPINEPFSEAILPLLERNLRPATESGCNEILHGGTAGFVRLADGYEAANFYSLHRPAGEDQIEFDWGTWVIGIEKWQGDYYVSFLVHFEWEI